MENTIDASHNTSSQVKTPEELKIEKEQQAKQDKINAALSKSRFFTSQEQKEYVGSVLPINWTMNRNLYALPFNHGTKDDEDPRMKAVFEKILERDQNTCRYCGFQSKFYMEVHHIDNNHENFEEENLACACPLCHKSHHLNIVGTLKLGKIITLPSSYITQDVLNNLLIHIFIALKHNPQKKEIFLPKLNLLEAQDAKILSSAYNTENLTVNLNNASDFASISLLTLEKNPNAIKNLQDLSKVLFFHDLFKVETDAWLKEKLEDPSYVDFFNNITDENNPLAQLLLKISEAGKKFRNEMKV